MPDAVAPDPLRSDVRTIGLIGLAHGSSHFFHLLLPPLFPWLIAEFGYSYAELSVMVSLFFVVSGVGQAMAGFAVDRFGARPILFAALGSFTVAGVVASLAQGYGMLLLAAFFAGLGNAPFHPVDFTILNKRVSAKRIGHAFSVHGLSGNIGWALAPLFMAGITTATGSWRLACLRGAALAAVILTIMVLNREALDDRAADAQAPRRARAAAAVPQEHPMAFLKLPSVWLCFVLLLEHLRAQRHPELCQPRHAVHVRTAAERDGADRHGLHAVRRGRHAGRWLPRGPRAAAGEGDLHLHAGLGCCAVPGRHGLAAGHGGRGRGLHRGPGHGPGRPLARHADQARRAPGATGRVYGTVYSGLDLGFCLAAPVFGYMLDHGMSHGVFYGSAIALVLSVVSAVVVGDGVSRKSGMALSAG